MTPDTPDWAAIERTPEFRALVRAKRAFIVPATLFFVAYYFALPALVGYWPGLMSTPVAGPGTRTRRSRSATRADPQATATAAAAPTISADRPLRASPRASTARSGR